MIQGTTSMAVGQGEDLAHMRQGIAAPLQQAGVVLGRQRRQGEEAPEHLRVLGVAALRHQCLGMIRVLVIPLAFVATDMAGDQLLVVIDAQMRRIRLQGHRGADEAGRDRIAVSLEGHPKLAIGAHRQHPPDIKQTRIDRLQIGALLGPQIHRPTLGFAMQPRIGHRFQPHPYRRVEGGEAR